MLILDKHHDDDVRTTPKVDWHECCRLVILLILCPSVVLCVSLVSFCVPSHQWFIFLCWVFFVVVWFYIILRLCAHGVLKVSSHWLTAVSIRGAGKWWGGARTMTLQSHVSSCCAEQPEDDSADRAAAGLTQGAVLLFSPRAWIITMYFVITAMKGECKRCVCVSFYFGFRVFFQRFNMIVGPRRSSTLLFVLYGFPGLCALILTELSALLYMCCCVW